ncbi:hypothetical protein OEA41_005659 [Lepraria neglecta]|uniref:General transcription and DNA repair factor IIH subunit TFB4 n=1 Tax=Lepraria neglecta TaxID=209136 RepID=A0AAD9Z7N3_9LECA|nr:hypothetical protein OEA41_005659 [Lepraria neglecta]
MNARAEFLYPLPAHGNPLHTSGSNSHNGADDGDAEMADGDETTEESSTDDANHYRPFRLIQSTLLASLSKLLKTTSPPALTPTTSIAGALTLALTYINKSTLDASTTAPTTSTTDPSLNPDSAPHPSTPASSSSPSAAT